MGKKQQKLFLPKLVIGYILAPVNKILRKYWLYQEEDSVPKKVGQYTLKKLTPSSYHEFKIAIYQDSKGKKGIAKIWIGYIKDYEYYTLQNEINIYKVLSKVINRTEKQIPNSLKNVSIPKLINVYESGNVLVLLLEYVDGKNGLNLNAENKYKIYKQVTEYLKFLGKNMSIDERTIIGERSLLSMVFMYPFLVLLALTANPHAWKKIIGSIPKFIQALPSIFFSHESQLIHRDFHFDNIILNLKKIVIIDFQFSIFSLWLIDIATMFRFVWDDKKFVNKILNDKKISETKRRNKDLFWLITMHSATHGLTEKGLSNSSKVSRTNYLNFAIKKNYTI